MAGNAGDLQATLSLENKQFIDALKDSTSAVESNTAIISQNFESVGDAIGAVSTAMVSLAALGGLKDFAAGLLDVANKSDKLEAVFQNLNGHTEKTKEIFEDLAGLEFKSMYDFEDTLGPAAINMMKLGVNADQAKDVMHALVDQAAGMKESPEWITKVSDTIATMQTHIVATGKDMKALQAEGINAWGALADEIGTSIKGAMDAVKAGTVSAQTVTDAVTKDIGAKWGGAAEESMDSWKGAIHILDEATEDLQKELGETIKGVLKDLKPVIDSIVQGMKDVTDWWKGLSEPVKEAVVVLTAAIGALTAVGIAMTALEAIGAAAAFNPVTLAVSALVAALALFAKWAYDNWPAIKAVFEEGVAYVSKIIDSFVMYFKEGVGYLSTLLEPLIDIWKVQFEAIKGVIEIAWNATKQFFSSVVEGLSWFINGLVKLGGSVPGVGEEIKKLGAIWDEQQKKMAEAAAAADAKKKKDQEARDAAVQAANASKQAAEMEAVREKQAAAAAAAAKKAADEEKKKAAEQAKWAAEWKAWNDKLEKSTEKLDESNKKLADNFQKAHDQMASNAQKTVDIVVSNYKRWGEATPIDTFLRSQQALKDLGVTSTAVYQKAIDDAKAHAATVQDAFEKGQASALDFQAAVKAVEDRERALAEYTNKDLTDAYHQFGLKTADEMNKMAGETEKAYQKIVDDAGADSVQAKEAWIKKTEETYANIIQQGGTLTEAQKAELDKRKLDLDEHLTTTQSTWKTAYDNIKNSVSGAFDDMIQKLATGDMSFSEVFKKMWQDLQSTVLHTFLDPVRDALAKFIATELADLISGSGNVLDNFKQLGNLGGIFGGKGGSTPSIPSVPTGGGGGSTPGVPSVPGAGDAAGEGGGLMDFLSGGLLGNIFSGISMVSGIIGNFQNARQEGTMNAIEHNTRYTMMYVGERSDGGILGQLFKIGDEIAFGNNVKANERTRDILFDWTGVLTPEVMSINQVLLGWGPYISNMTGCLEEIRIHTANMEYSLADTSARAINVSVTATGVTPDTAKALGNEIALGLSRQLVGATLR